ncbi:MAG: hypothetical protein LBK57_03630 [Clostridiales Family XIII bacterium]|jgi:hypothetical protein|nr:hypothetical protein [Clostridiales Family XIII bacterium]
MKGGDEMSTKRQTSAGPEYVPCDEYPVAEDVRIDVSLIPDYAAETLAAATIGFIKRILDQPGGREMLDARTAARKARQAVIQ